jgi:RNA polymerase sigma-70 factor, ECF subfamily
VAIEGLVRQAMLDAIPHLRAFAISLTGNITGADDLVQAALLRRLENLDKFQPGTSMRAWRFTILRNQFYTDTRKSRREVDDLREAAQICGTSLGTIKSRVNRARTRLAELLAISSEEDLDPDSLVKAALVMHSTS